MNERRRQKDERAGSASPDYAVDPTTDAPEPGSPERPVDQAAASGRQTEAGGALREGRSDYRDWVEEVEEGSETARSVGPMEREAEDNRSR